MDPYSAEHPFHERRTRDRAVQELLGLCKGIIADGVVNDGEAVALRQWLEQNPAAAASWPGNVIYDRLLRVFEDGVIEEDERTELEELLLATVGESRAAADATAHATRLPLSDPPPQCIFRGKLYAFTGTFCYGTRTQCEAAVVERGGRCGSGVTLHTDFLVIGTLPTGAWQFTTHGRKIERAIEYRRDGQPIAIVSEEHWVKALR